jgi:hypothetical protein
MQSFSSPLHHKYINNYVNVKLFFYFFPPRVFAHIYSILMDNWILMVWKEELEQGALPSSWWGSVSLF